MSKIHVLTGAGGAYTVVVHAPVPTGTNTVGVTWKAALIGAGLNVTAMNEGNGAGQITTAEKATVEAGDVVEGHFTWGDIPGADNQTLVADLALRADQLIAELLARLSVRLRYFGYTAN